MLSTTDPEPDTAPAQVACASALAATVHNPAIASSSPPYPCLLPSP